MAVKPDQKVYNLDGKRIIVDEEFRKLIRPLTPQELGLLEANLIADARCTDPLVIWAEQSILLDGHHRIEIATARDIPYKVVRINLPDRDAAIRWIEDHQLGKRNVDEADRNNVKERRERVAAAKLAGESNRSIADKEGVSEHTIRKDAEATGAKYTAPATATGKDGKTRPSRAARTGQNFTPPPPKLPKGERLPGDDTDSEKAARKSRKSDTKNGAVFGWKDFNKTFSQLILYVDKLGKIYKKHNSPDADVLRKRLVDWKGQMKDWYGRLSKQAAPDEPHEKLAAAASKSRRGKGKK